MTHTWPNAIDLCTPLVCWFRSGARTLPWRAKNLDGLHPDPYVVLVSELMLQQTQVVTVIPYFERWMDRFPDPLSLAQSDEKTVHKLWEGLGYYRRARYLQAAARIIVEKGWPTDLQGLRALPGLGDYTAAAVASIAFQHPEAALDGNAFRVLARVLGLEENPKNYAADLRTWLRPALEAHGPSRLTQALMELGSLTCTRRPRCEVCPWAVSCRALDLGITHRIPSPQRMPTPMEIDLFLVAIQAEGHWLLERPSSQGLLAGLWRWQTLPASVQGQASSCARPLETPSSSSMHNLYVLPEQSTIPAIFADRAAEKHEPYQALEATTWPTWVQIYSHRKERVTPLRLDMPQRFDIPENQAWIPSKELEGLPMGKRDQKLRRLLQSHGETYQGPNPWTSLVETWETGFARSPRGSRMGDAVLPS